MSVLLLALAASSSTVTPQQLMRWMIMRRGRGRQTQGAGLTVVGTFSSVGRYTKVGNLVYVTGYVSGSTSIAIAAGSILCSNLIFTQAIDGCGGNCTNYNVNQTAGLFATGGSTNLYATSALTASISIIFGFTFRV
jgi:hypothetical protein